MTELILTTWDDTKKFARNKKNWRIILPIIYSLLFIMLPSGRTVIMQSMADAFITVAVFVAATLGIFYGAENYFNFDSDAFLNKHKKWQIVFSAFLGALPGCGGAIIVVSQYVKGVVGFSSLIAVLTATMGDAAFLVLAKDPKSGALLLLLGLSSGICFGHIVHFFHKDQKINTLKPEQVTIRVKKEAEVSKQLKLLWVIIAIIGLFFGLSDAFQIEIQPIILFDNYIDLALTFGFLGTLVSIFIWSKPTLSNSYKDIMCNQETELIKDEEDNSNEIKESILNRVIFETSFVLSWVLSAFIIFNLFLHYTGIDLKTLFQGASIWAPLIGTIIGFLPGCGPQIIIATLYLAGIIPLSVQASNSISNDGDALFPAIALAPKAAVLATVYTAIPALLIGYIMLFLGY